MGRRGRPGRSAWVGWAYICVGSAAVGGFGKKVIYKYIKHLAFDFLSRFGRFVPYVMVGGFYGKF